MKDKVEQVWYEYHDQLARFIRTKASEEVADDLLQEVFIKIQRNIETLKTDSKLENWLYQITRNTIADYYRKHKTTDGLPDWLAQEQADDALTIRQELALCLIPMINHLPDKYRKAIQMSEIEGKTQQQVATEEGISLSGAKSRVQRGRAQLKIMLHDCCEIEMNSNHQITHANHKKNCNHC